MKKNNLKTATALALAGVLIAAPITAEAATYNDVGSNHWAYSYISNLSDLNIVRGYTDGSFKPQRSVTYLEILQLLKGIQNPTNQQVTEAIYNNGDIAEMYRVPSWAKSAVCVALQNGVITETNLKAAYNRGYITGTTQEEQFPNRETILIYYAKALGITPKEDTSNIKVNDIDAIGKTPKELIGDVDIKGIYAAMIDTTIFHEMGSDGNFNPQQPLKREQMAKITDLSYDYKNKVKNAKEYEGEIYLLENVNGVSTVAIKDKDDKSIAFVLTDDTKITVNGKVAEQKDLTEGSKVKVTAYADTTGVTSLRAVSIDVDVQDLVGTGIVKSIDDKEMALEYTTDKNATIDPNFKPDKKATLKLNSDTVFKMFGTKIKASDVSVDDMVTFSSKNGTLTEVNVFPEKGTVTGEFVNYDYGSRFGNERRLYLKLDDGNTYTFTVKSDDLDKELRKLVNDLNEGYPLTIGTHYRDVVSVDEVKGEVEGVLKDISSDFNGYKITMRTSSGDVSYQLKEKRNEQDQGLLYKGYGDKDWKEVKPEDLYYYFRKEGPEKFGLRLYLVGNKVEKVEWVSQLEEKGYIFNITNVRESSRDFIGSSWAAPKLDGYSAYSFDLVGSDYRYAFPKNSQYFYVREKDENAILRNKDSMKLKIDIYKTKKGYAYTNMRVSGKYDLNDLRVYEITQGINHK